MVPPAPSGWLLAPPQQRVRANVIVAAVMLAYLVGAVFLWYGSRGTWLGSSEAVVLLWWVGAAVFFGAVWAAAGLAPWRLSRETWVVALSGLLLFTALWLFGRRGSYGRWFGDQAGEGWLAPLYSFFFFSAATVVFRMVLPLLTARVVLGRRPADYGYSLHGTFRLWWVYLLAVIVAVPLVAWASTFPSFLRKYPLCRDAITDGTLDVWVFGVYQLAYGLVFASGEAFWRGYLLFGLERQLGSMALWFMLVPYVTGHFGKPMPESFGAIGAGVFLGALALKHRSFWLGVATHWAVALMMDLFAIAGRGVVFE